MTVDYWASGVCASGHDVTDPANVIVRVRKNGKTQRQCKPCKQDRDGNRKPRSQRNGPQLDLILTDKQTVRLPTYLLTPAPPIEMSEQAGCRGQKELFESIDNITRPRVTRSKTHPETLQRGALLCRYSCPVKQMCSDYADEHELVGLWGGSIRFPSKTGVRGAPYEKIDVVVDGDIADEERKAA